MSLLRSLRALPRPSLRASGYAFAYASASASASAYASASASAAAASGAGAGAGAGARLGSASYSSVPQPAAPMKSLQPGESTPAALQQSPNVPTTWSTSQNPKPAAYDNARFEQIALDLQPNPPSAMGMVAQDPVRLVPGRRATCDGGGGPLGHPKIFINLDKPGPKACGYCGIKYEQAHEHH